MKKLHATTALGLLLLPLISLAAPQKTTTLTIGGYAGTTTLADFPVLVRLSAARLDGFDPLNCAANGADVWFASDAAGANPIPHEIERWDESGESAIWVRIPELSPTNPQPTTFYMFWQDDAPPANETTNVWNGADYRAVWHMSEASTTQRDSTAIGLAATMDASATVSTGAGMAGLAIKKGAALSAPDFFAAENGGVDSRNYSVSTWVYLPGAKAGALYYPMGKGGVGVDSWCIEWLCAESTRNLRFKTGIYRPIHIGDIRTAWTMITFTYDGTSIRLFNNGTIADTVSSPSLGAGTEPFVLNESCWYDETRVRNTASSADWVKAEYDSVDNADFVTTADLAPNYIRVAGDTPLANERGMDYGVHNGLEVGQEYSFSVPEYGTNETATATYRCTGWTLALTNGTVVSSTAESPRRCTVEFAAGMERATLTWKWTVIEYKLDAVVAGQGAIDVESQFVTTGGVVTLNAASAAGWKFWRWTCDGVTGASRYLPSLTLTMDAAKTVTASFYDPAATARAVRYVVPGGAGTKAGTSWENACGSIATAYEKATEYPCADVWIKKGRYALSSPIAIVPRICVRGGFAGTETRAEEADPKANPTILAESSYNATKEKWDDTHPMWTGDDLLTFVDPPEKGDAVGCFTPNSWHGGGKSFENTDGAPTEDNELSGLSFFENQPYAVKLTTRNAATFSIRNCRFLACGWDSHNRAPPLWVENCPVEVTDCDFIGCENTVRVLADTAVTTNVFARCRFYDNVINWTVKYDPPRAAGIAVGGTAYLRVSSCWFEKCRDINEAAGSAVQSGTLALQSTAGGLVEDTVICRSYVNLPTRGIVCIAADEGARFEFNRCRFERNTYVGGGCGSVGAGLSCFGTGKLYVNDSYFMDNLLTNSTFSSPGASCVAVSTTWDGHFRNCTFENNVSHGDNNVERNTLAFNWTGHRAFGFVNCVFNNNRCGNSATTPYGKPEFTMPDIKDRDQRFAFVNCVFANDDARYKPFGTDLSWDYDFSFASCVSSSSLVGWGTAAAETFRYQPLDNGTLAPLKGAPETNGTVVARGIATASAYRRKGIPVFSDRDGDLYIYDTAYNKDKPWRLLRNTATVCSDAEGAARGLSRRNPIPDAFDRARNRLRTTLGPLDYRSGAALRLR